MWVHAILPAMPPPPKHAPHLGFKVVWRAVAAQYSGDALRLAVTARESDLLAVRLSDALARPGAAPSPPLWTLSAKGQVRAAHSFAGEQFGPCQAVHGITWVVTAEFTNAGAPLVEDHAAAAALVQEVPRGRRPQPCSSTCPTVQHAPPERPPRAPASINLIDSLGPRPYFLKMPNSGLPPAQACGRYDQKDMDAHPDFAGQNTTCEVMARALWELLAEALGPWSRRRGSVKVTVDESDEAYVEFEQGAIVEQLLIFEQM